MINYIGEKILRRALHVLRALTTIIRNINTLSAEFTVYCVELTLINQPFSDFYR